MARIRIRVRDCAGAKLRAQPLSASALLQLMQLASPALPVGGFSYSEALEAAVDAGIVSDGTSAQTWLLGQLHLSLSRSDLAVVNKAFGAWQRGDFEHIAELNAWVTTTRETSELRQQTEQMGRSLGAWMKNRAESANADEAQGAAMACLTQLTPAPTWPVAFALATFNTGAPCREALLSFAFGWAENMMQAALKSVPLGQSAGQRILAALSADIPAAVDHAMGLMDGERMAFTPMLAILSAQHETQYSRLFRS
jgi:urease accessory protein